MARIPVKGQYTLNFHLALLTTVLMMLMNMFSLPTEKNIISKNTTFVSKKIYPALEFDLLEEAIKGNVVKPTYHGKIFRTGCYLYMNGEKVFKREAPSSLRELFNCSRQMPSVLIVGVKKCGTTTLSTFLGLHPQVEGVEGVMIEEEQTLRVEALKFLKEMPYVTPGMIVLSDFPGYSDKNREQLFDVIPYLGQDVKIIFILKDPAKRAHSDFDHMKILSGETVPSNVRKFKDNVLNNTFQDTVLFPNGSVNHHQRLVQLGMYAKTIKLFMTKFPTKNIIVLDGEEFARNPVKTLTFLETELHLSHFFTNEHFIYIKSKKFYCSNVPSRPDQYCMSEKKGRKHGEVPEWLLLKFQRFYEPYNRELKKLLRDTFHSEQPFDWLEVPGGQPVS